MNPEHILWLWEKVKEYLDWRISTAEGKVITLKMMQFTSWLERKYSYYLNGFNPTHIWMLKFLRLAMLKRKGYVKGLEKKVNSNGNIKVIVRLN